MRRLSGFTMAGVIILLALLFGVRDGFAQQSPFSADLVLNSVTINPDRTADYEEILQRLRDALQGSDDPSDRQIAQGWRVYRNIAAMPNGDVVYTHVIEPPSGATADNYGVMQRLYDAFPDEQQTLYQMYQEAFSQNLGLSPANLIEDMSR
jgi:hypothetical protein